MAHFNTISGHAAAPSFVSALADRFAVYKKERDLRKAYVATVRSLSELSDRELKDIGVHRGQIEEVAFRTTYSA